MSNSLTENASLAWKPSAAVSTLRLRAQMLANIRAFFAEREVMEVVTPTIASAASTDVHLHSLQVDTHTSFKQQAHWLLTSPELPIKRLLCAGVGDCYQIGSAFRQGEVGRFHNPEFQLLEWYRLGFDLSALMDEVAALILALCHTLNVQTPLVETYSYQTIFQKNLSIDPLEIEGVELNQRLHADSLWDAKQEPLCKDAALELLFDQAIAVHFPSNQLTLIRDYPASQAALAKLTLDDSRTAQRFELYWGNVELANGFYELQDANEQRARFEQDNQQRVQNNLPAMPIDEYFLTALEQGGLPDCSGVALGLDRLLMKLGGFEHITDVLSFDWSRV